MSANKKLNTIPRKPKPGLKGLIPISEQPKTCPSDCVQKSGRGGKTKSVPAPNRQKEKQSQHADQLRKIPNPASACA